jgi:hypothetical protein
VRSDLTGPRCQALGTRIGHCPPDTGERSKTGTDQTGGSSSVSGYRLGIVGIPHGCLKTGQLYDATIAWYTTPNKIRKLPFDKAWD